MYLKNYTSMCRTSRGGTLTNLSFLFGDTELLSKAMFSIFILWHKRYVGQNLLTLAWILNRQILGKLGEDSSKVTALWQSSWLHGIKPRFWNSNNSSSKNAGYAWLVWKLSGKEMLLQYIVQDISAAYELKHSVLTKCGIGFKTYDSSRD